MKTWDTGIISELLYEASHIAIDHYRKPEISLKSDKTIVTQADREIEALLARRLDNPEEGSYLIGEETVETRDERYIRGAFTGTAWVVDPIDGTVPYAHHIPTWGISIGMMEKGRIVNGAVYIPMTGELFMTDGDTVLAGVSKDGRLPDLSPMTIRRAPAGESGVISLTQGMARSGNLDLPNPVLALCCAVVPMVYLPLGRIMTYIGSLKLWDIAGALSILLSAGFLIRFANGKDLTRDVTDEFYRLDPGDARRWYTRDHIVCAPSEEVYTYMKKGITSLP